MKDKIKPKYNAAQNVGWMVKIAWKVRKRVLFICVAMAALEVLYNLTQLYVAPEILSCVERHAPVGELLGTIGLFTLALFLTMGLREYFREIDMYPRVDVRSSIVGMIGRKCNMTSFSNTLDVKFIKLKEKAHKKHTEQQGSDGKHLGDPDQTAAERGRFSGVPCHPVQPELGAAGGDCCDLRGGISGVPAFQQLDFPAPG